ncbi:MAG: InlB B-repeat-containing protein [Bacilli bacterium]|nr:InlB B-repeat-containing protein [Bacilli bacterium]
MKKRFIFDESYIKRYAKKDKMKWLVIGVSSLVLIIIIIIVILATRGDKKPNVDPIVPVFEFKEELVLEAGSTLPEAVDYFTKLENVDINDIKIEYPNEFEIGYDMNLCSAEEMEAITNGDRDIEDFECVVPILKNPALYGITIYLLDKEYTVNLIVQDKTSPVIITKDLEIFDGDEYKPSDFVQLCYDVSGDCKISFYDKDVDSEGNKIIYSDIKKVGTHVVKIVAEDVYGNISEPMEANLVINGPDTIIYTVSFNSDGGSAVDSIRVQEGGSIAEPSAPVKEGYYFAGWYLDNIAFDFKNTINQDITLVAKWEVIPDDPVTPKPPTGGDKPQVQYVRSIALDIKTMYLYAGDTKSFKVTVNPSNAVNGTVTWASSDPSIASVQNGVVTAHKAGTVTVTATAGGKTASSQVVVKNKSGGGSTDTTCKYGDTSYDTSKILSVSLIKNNCAVDPNITYNDSVDMRDNSSITSKLTSMGFQTKTNQFSRKSSYYSVKNNAGTGLVGYQITVDVYVMDPDTGKFMSASYIIKPDGSRKFLSNNIERNGVKLS